MNGKTSTSCGTSVVQQIEGTFNERTHEIVVYNFYLFLYLSLGLFVLNFVIFESNFIKDVNESQIECILREIEIK